ncbi:MAG TPA: DUF4440 domain-containing protein [Pyrinomonadaceae bacterium]|nr:DUF4440 domain-containing protein [Pyrinomonadaceae bacterium]
MKKYLALATFLMIVATGCSTEPPATNAPAAANANSSTAKATATISEADATAKEKATWDAIKKKDLDGFASMLATDYVEIGGDGIYDKEGIVAYLKDLNVTDATFADWKMLTIDKDAYILTYSLTLKATFKGTAVPPGPYRAGAAWVNRDGKWVAAYYQETFASKPAANAPPPPAGSPAAKSSTGSTSVATGPDPIANEKLVWDAIKSRNYDQFALFLAADALEVEPDGVYDKSSSVKGVSSVDLSKAELGDWKSAKFDADAMLVTYTVTTPGAKVSKERHSTIWVNRDGKWQALYHQGTPVEAAAAAATKPATSK